MYAKLAPPRKLSALSEGVNARPMNTPEPYAPDASSFAPASGASAIKWFTEEVHVHAGSLRSYLRSAFPSVHDVDDVMQESFLRVWRARTFEPIRFSKSFLFKVARHLAIDHIRHLRASPLISVPEIESLPVLDERASVLDRARNNEEVGMLIDAVDALPARCREIVMLRKLSGLSQKKIASRLGISEQTVQVQVVRGVKRCAKYLRHRGLKR